VEGDRHNPVDGEMRISTRRIIVKVRWFTVRAVGLFCICIIATIAGFLLLLERK